MIGSSVLGTHDIGLFIISGLLLNLMPGPDTFLVMSRSATHGFRIGSAATLGIGAGVFVHVIAAALGLSALLATSATAFTVVKWAGAAYLLYLGFKMLITRPAVAKSGTDSSADAPLDWRKAFLQGLTTNVLNPKVALFFLAFVPQFIHANAPSTALAFIFLGTVFNINSMIWCHALAVLTSMAKAKVCLPAAVGTWLHRGVGLFMMGFGLRLALSEQ